MRMSFVYALVVLASAFTSADEPLPDVVEFNRDVRPVLSDKCFFCHGPDKNKREADLRLDTQQGLFGSNGEPGTVVPKQPEQSELYRRITSADPDLKMPPKESAKELSAREIALLKTWVEQGAPFEGHWAFEPVKRVAPPDAQGLQPLGFLKNAIDQFVLAELQLHKLSPAQEADKITLIRRVSFDLTGLPPTPEVVAAFVADNRPDAYEALVDRLLDSPHFGERMAVWWLDLVRYADTVGYHGDQDMSVYPFREYVIQSFNDNKPFDVFTREQLAGDLLPEPTKELKIASGYNRLGMMSAEGGVQDKEYLAKYIAERVRNVSGTWMGTTLGCAECHDHKYDPFTTKDFYSFEAFFADIEERGLYSGSYLNGAWGPRMDVPSPEQAARMAKLNEDISNLRKVLDMPTEELATAQTAWEQTVPLWTVLAPDMLTSQNGAMLKKLDDNSVLVSGENPATDVYTITTAANSPAITAIRLEVLPDDSLPKQGPGRSGNGNFVLTEFVVEQQAQPVALQNATASFEQTSGAENFPQKKFAIASVIDPKADAATRGWAIADQIGKRHVAVFEAAQPIAAGSALTIKLVQSYATAQHTLGRFRISVTSHPLPVRADHGPPANIAAILAVAVDLRTEAQRNELAAHYRTIAPLLEPQRAKFKELEQAKADLQKTIPTTLVTNPVAPRMVRVLNRGNWMDESGEVVTPAFPAFLPHPEPAADKRLTRVDLAAWLMAADNPLTARVFANRQWKLFFGAGLSRRLEDLGGQGESPTHPLLLDYLATQFRESNWNVKQFVKLLVMSGTYRQSSRDTPQLRELDPYNRLLARQSRFRLDAEFVRDNALSVSGLLVTRLGGPSVRPYQPPGYWAYLNFPMREWQNGAGEELYRRGIYTHWQRQYLHPSLLAFDAPSREECTADRPKSNTPLQSLALLNDPTYVEAARALAERTMKDGGSTPAERFGWLFRSVLSRNPRPAEIEVLTALLTKHQQEYTADGASAKSLTTIGSKPVAADVDPVELAAWTSVTRALLNLHETMTRN